MSYFELGPSEPFFIVYERATGELPEDRGIKYTGKHHKHLMEQEKATLTTQTSRSLTS